MQSTRTSLLLPTTMHQQLLSICSQQGQSLSEFIRLLLDKAIQQEEAHRRKKVYRAFRKVQGICKDPVTDASSTIDDVLYGGQS